MIELADVVVSPYTDLLDTPRGGSYHRGGPSWPDWDLQTSARHNVGGQPVDVQPNDATPHVVVDKPFAWAGAIVWHFGHLVADFSMRMVPTLAARPDLPFAFASKPEWRMNSIGDTPQHFREILDWLGIAENRVRIVTTPTRFTQLAVAAQAEQVDEPNPLAPRPEVGPTEVHLDAMDRLTYERFGKLERSGTVYVSRASQHARFAGEAYLEEQVARAGVRIIRPETRPIREQLQAYSRADLVVFAEGSAIHAAKLIGRNLGRVVIVVRRSGPSFARASLAPRAESLDYLDATLGLVCPTHVAGVPAYDRGLSVVDDDSLLAGLASSGIDVSPHWSHAAFNRRREEDVLRWVDEELASERGDVPGTREMIVETLGTAGLGHLTDRVAQRLSARTIRPSDRRWLRRLKRVLPR